MDTLRSMRLSAHALAILIVLGCFLKASAAGQAGDGQQVVYEGNQIVVEGDPLTITCHLTAFDPVKWQRDEQTIVPDSLNQYAMQEEKVNGKIVAKLSVPQAQHSHSGSYRCTSFYNLSHHVYVLSANSVVANTDHENYKTMEYNKQLVLQCNVSNAESANQFVMTWLKEGKPVVPDDKIKIIESENKLVISKASEDHYGNYTCQAVNKNTNTTESVMKKSIHVIMGPVITMPSDTPVVEGERLRLHCSVKGYPTPLVDWSVDGKVLNISDSRIKFDDDKDVRKAFLLIENVQMSDRHSYKCKASNIANQDNTGAEAVTFVRVKDKLAALWPFLGICAEVAILCTIILIYEKKRNKAELDESDTDQSPEQKNTPDHGKDVRQRK